MSLEAITAVLHHSRHPGTTKLVLLTLADLANERGECWPGVDYIARLSNCTARRAVDLIAALERDGTIEIARGKGPRGCNIYSLRRWIEYQVQQAARGLGAERNSTPAPENIAGVKTLQGVKPGAAGDEMEREEGVKSGGAGLHPIPEDPTETPERTRGALASAPVAMPRPEQPPPSPSPSLHSLDPRPPQCPDWVPRSLWDPDFLDALRKWREHLTEKGHDVSRMQWLATMQACERAGLRRTVQVIDFSLLRGAKNLIWDTPEKHAPTICTLPARTNRPGETEPPGFTAWAEQAYAKNRTRIANDVWKRETTWTTTSDQVRREFIAAHPQLAFQGVRYLGPKGEGRAA